MDKEFRDITIYDRCMNVVSRHRAVRGSIVLYQNTIEALDVKSNTKLIIVLPMETLGCKVLID